MDLIFQTMAHALDRMSAKDEIWEGLLTIRYPVTIGRSDYIDNDCSTQLRSHGIRPSSTKTNQ